MMIAFTLPKYEKPDRIDNEPTELEGRAGHSRYARRYARRFAETFMSTIKSWSSAKPKPTISAKMYVGVDESLTVFVFTLGRPDAVSFANASEIKQLIARALEIAPQCDPAKGDLAVFDGLKILMFRHFNERLGMKSARAAASEVASHILMKKKEFPPCPPAANS